MIAIEYKPTLAVLFNGKFECQHPRTTSDEFEHYDHRKEAETGLPQPLTYEPIENCDDCSAYYSTWDEEWHDGGSI